MFYKIFYRNFVGKKFVGKKISSVKSDEFLSRWRIFITDEIFCRRNFLPTDFLPIRYLPVYPPALKYVFGTLTLTQSPTERDIIMAHVNVELVYCTLVYFYVGNNTKAKQLFNVIHQSLSRSLLGYLLV